VALVVVLGEAARVEGFALAGATVITADGADAVLRAWTQIGDDAAVVVLTAAASAALEDAGVELDGVLTVVMPS
jgi:vacuolar-type H+-ATPase subunit F/Vma7